MNLGKIWKGIKQAAVIVWPFAKAYICGTKDEATELLTAWDTLMEAQFKSNKSKVKTPALIVRAKELQKIEQ